MNEDSVRVYCERCNTYLARIDALKATGDIHFREEFRCYKCNHKTVLDFFLASANKNLLQNPPTRG